MGLFAGLDPKLRVEQTGFMSGTEHMTREEQKARIQERAKQIDRFQADSSLWMKIKSKFQFVKDVATKTAFVPEEMDLENE